MLFLGSRQSACGGAAESQEIPALDPPGSSGAETSIGIVIAITVIIMVVVVIVIVIASAIARHSRIPLPALDSSPIPPRLAASRRAEGPDFMPARSNGPGKAAPKPPRAEGPDY